MNTKKLICNTLSTAIILGTIVPVSETYAQENNQPKEEQNQQIKSPELS